MTFFAVVAANGLLRHLAADVKIKSLFCVMRKRFGRSMRAIVSRKHAVCGGDNDDDELGEEWRTIEIG